MKGVYVELPGDGVQAGSYAVTLDANGKELTRERLTRANGTVRFLPPVDPNAPPPGGSGRGAGRGGSSGNSLPPNSPYTRPDYSYKAGEWNALELLLDANILRAWLNDGPEIGRASCRERVCMLV